MARFFVGSADEFESHTFAPQHQGTIEFLRNQVQEVATGWGDSLTASAQSFIEKAKGTFDKFYSSEALALSRAALRKTQSLFQRDVICTLSTVEEFQHATPRNQRYNMAFPQLRKLYQEQMCDGYTDTYIDHQPGAIGRDHQDFRRIYDGEVSIDADGDTVVTHYIDDGSDKEPEVPFDERMIVRDNHTVLEWIVAQGGGDPSNKSGGTL